MYHVTRLYCPSCRSPPEEHCYKRTRPDYNNPICLSCFGPLVYAPSEEEGSIPSAGSTGHLNDEEGSECETGDRIRSAIRKCCSICTRSTQRLFGQHPICRACRLDTQGNHATCAGENSASPDAPKGQGVDGGKPTGSAVRAEDPLGSRIRPEKEIKDFDAEIALNYASLKTLLGIILHQFEEMKDEMKVLKERAAAAEVDRNFSRCPLTPSSSPTRSLSRSQAPKPPSPKRVSASPIRRRPSPKVQRPHHSSCARLCAQTRPIALRVIDRELGKRAAENRYAGRGVSAFAATVYNHAHKNKSRRREKSKSRERSVGRTIKATNKKVTKVKSIAGRQERRRYLH